METFVAACANCASFSAGACDRNLAPPAGEPRCDAYQIGDRFASELAGAVMRGVTFSVPIPLGKLSAKGKKSRAPSNAGVPRKGFRATKR